LIEPVEITALVLIAQMDGSTKRGGVSRLLMTYPNWLKFKQRQLYKHFYLFLDRHHVDKAFVPTRESWTAFIKSESYGKASLSFEELNLAAPWFRAKTNWEITLQSVWQELADTWSSGWGWDAVLRHNISFL